MSLTKFEKDMDVVQKLDDEPNDVGGLTSAALKAKFDEGGKAVKEYLNDVLLPALDAYIARTDNPHAVTKAQVGLGSADNTADADKPVSTEQQAAIALKADLAAVLTKTNTSAFTPSASYHPATKKYVDDMTTSVVLGQIPDGTITQPKLAENIQVSPTAHAATHHTGGSDPMVPGDIGAATANHVHSASEITLSDAAAGKYGVETVSDALLHIPAQNLLVNWDFRNPVNQRNKTTYDSSIDGVDAYTIDRWKFGVYSQTLTLSSDGLIFSNWKCLSQIIENPNTLLGKRVTASFQLSDGTIHSGTLVLPLTDGHEAFCSDGTGNVCMDYNLSAGATKLEIRLVNFAEGTPLTIRAVKLELGSASTLAYDITSDPALELARVYGSPTSIGGFGGFLSMCTVSYTGTGAYGDNNATVIVFPFAPKLIVVSMKDAKSTPPMSYDTPWIIDLTALGVSTDARQMIYSPVGQCHGYKSSDGKTLYLYGSPDLDSSAGQLNYLNTIYTIHAIG